MNLNNFTIKSQEAIQQAAQIATGNGQQAIENGHILKAILEIDENVTPFILKKLGVNQSVFSKTVDAIVSNGEVTNSHAGLKADNLKVIQMNLQSARFYNLLDNQQQSDASAFSNQKVLAIAGIGNPERFFLQLRKLGLSFDAHSYADHHAFQSQDFESVAADIVLMTEKDAVKCQAFAQSNFWVLPVHAVINNDLIAIVLNKLNMRK